VTRRDQTTRAWISRESLRHCYLSHVSHKGKVSTLRTPTKLRKAAREFNVTHTVLVLTKQRPSRTKAKAPKETQDELNL
jgi:hypothetical protein